MLVDGIALEPTDATLRSRLAALDARHPLLLLTNAGDVTVTTFDGEDPRVIATGRDASWAVWSPDRTRAAFLSDSGDDEDWHSELWTVDADGSGQRLLADNAFSLGSPSWSPDGRSVVYVTTDDFDRNRGQGWVGLRLIDLETGAQRNLTGRRFHFTTSVVWSPDGRHIAFVERHIYRLEDSNQLDVRGGDVFLLDLGTGESRNLTKGRIRDAWTVSWSPRGDRMMIATDVDQWASADPNHLYRLDVTTGAIEELETGGVVTSYPYWSPDGSMFAVVQDDRVVRIFSEEDVSWVRLPTNVDSVLSWSPDGTVVLAPPKNYQDVTHLIHVGEELGRIDTIRVMFDNSYSSGGPPQWSARTR
ncbi:MAG: tolB protein precursor, periplasmic protein involved in the tonb-independent uptake of group A colicins, partial [uncultured Nocardioidaceae bacterium]